MEFDYMRTVHTVEFVFVCTALSTVRWKRSQLSLEWCGFFTITPLIFANWPLNLSLYIAPEFSRPPVPLRDFHLRLSPFSPAPTSLSLLSLSRSTAYGKPFQRCCCFRSQLLSSLKGSQRKTEPERIEAMKAGVLLLPLASLYSLQNSRLVDDKKKSSSNRSFFPFQIASAADETPASFLLFPKSPSQACNSRSRSTPSKAPAAVPQGKVSGRAATGVKSKPYEASKSVMLLEKGAEARATISWLEQFPKRA